MYEFIQNNNFLSAEQLFDNDVVSFGTWTDVVQGLEQLKSNQWENIWTKQVNSNF